MANGNERWMEQAIELAVQNVRSGRGGPFGAVIVKDDRLIASGTNIVTSSNDPTAHAEVVAIRAACKDLAAFQLSGCELYTSCEPCPMCLSAIYWARLARYFYACNRQDAADAGFDDAFLYDQLMMPTGLRAVQGFCLRAEECIRPFAEWNSSLLKILY